MAKKKVASEEILEEQALFLEDSEVYNEEVPHLVEIKDRGLRQSNALVEARYSLSTIEQKILMAIIAQMDDNSHNFHVCKMSLSALSKYCGFGRNGNANIRKTTKNIMEKVLTFRREGKQEYLTHWVQSCSISEDNDYIIYELDHKLQPELLQLKRAFVSEPDPKVIFQLKSSNSIRIYFLLKQYIKIGRRTITPEELIDMLQLSSTYKEFSHLRTRIIEPAVKEINAKTSLEVSVEYDTMSTKGRKVKAIVFHIARKNKIDSTEEIAKLPEVGTELIEKMKEQGILGSVAKSLIEEYGEDHCRNNYEYAMKTMGDNKESPAGYIVSIIKKDAAGEAATQKKVKDEKKAKKVAEIDSLIKQSIKEDEEKKAAQPKVEIDPEFAKFAKHTGKSSETH